MRFRALKTMKEVWTHIGEADCRLVLGVTEIDFELIRSASRSRVELHPGEPDALVYSSADEDHKAL